MTQLFAIMKYFKNVTPFSTKLGRWRMDDTRKTELKILYANEDNCGVCEENKYIEDIENTKEIKEDYYKAFVVN